MKEIKIEHLVYWLKEAKKNNERQPIFFLGAGASKTGGIPLTDEIVKDILEKYSDSPFIYSLPAESRNDYATLMKRGLHPYQRNELLKGYINKAQINVTHIYLAQLLKEGFVDYILTTNFDNLILRASSLFNIFPPTYDMAIFRDFTTTTFQKKSVVYLHGQSHGVWMLNTDDEMDKVSLIVPRIFDSIKNERPWIFIGYSGSDPIIKHIKNLGRFDHGLYWVTYYDESPQQDVVDLLSDSNTNGFLIKGYDADSFMLKLNRMLGLKQPDIVDKPFSALKEMLSNIVDIDDKEHFGKVKERMDISLRQVSEAINTYEESRIEQPEIGELKKTTEIDLLKREIIDIIISENYDKNTISRIEKKAKELDNESLSSLLSSIYCDWGNYLGALAQTKSGEDAEGLFRESFEKYAKAVEIKPDKHEAFYNWGNYLGALAQTKSGEEADALFRQAFEKYEKAVDLGGRCYNLACGYALKGMKKEALLYLERSLERKEITPSFVLKDEDWKQYLQDKDFMDIINKYQN